MATATLVLGTNWMPIFGWIRDALGLHKDIIDSKKAKLEVHKLEDEKRERDILTRATFEDIERYDPKIQLLKKQIKNVHVARPINKVGIMKLLILLGFLFLSVYLLIWGLIKVLVN